MAEFNEKQDWNETGICVSCGREDYLSLTKLCSPCFREKEKNQEIKPTKGNPIVFRYPRNVRKNDD